MAHHTVETAAGACIYILPRGLLTFRKSGIRPAATRTTVRSNETEEGQPGSIIPVGPALWGWSSQDEVQGCADCADRPRQSCKSSPLYGPNLSSD
jgi:hypothetical protein